MNVLKSVILVVVLALTLVSSSRSRQRSLTNEGTDFWFDFMPNELDPAKTIDLFFASIPLVPLFPTVWECLG